VGQEYYSGRIVKLEDRSSNATAKIKVVADSPALFRPFGLAIRNGDIFVSRSGVLPTAKDGDIEYASSGFVTRLRDLDGDGFMEYLDDIVSGMPGARGPNMQHSNYGIAFAPDGSLFVSTGSSTNRDPFDHPWEGKILRVSPNYESVEVYADGFRNPFGLAIGPDGELFATDNDETIVNPGDELNHVVAGGHYGHPYVIGSDDGGGDFTVPVSLSPGESTYTGLTYMESDSLPDKFRNCLYIADFLGGKIWKVGLTRRANTYVAEASVFAEVSLPVDIAATSSGELYITTRHGYLYRIRRNREVR
jgi:glucose/arabinose dehydrogenase